MYIVYRDNAGDEVVLMEGRICDDLSTCTDPYPAIGPASFDGLAATMKNMGGMYLVVVSPHSIPGYALYSTTLSQAKVAQFAAAMVKVPKP